jgi:hypothetical protein
MQRRKKDKFRYWCGSGIRCSDKRKLAFIKYHIMGNVNPIRWHMETLVALMRATISQEHALHGSK